MNSALECLGNLLGWSIIQSHYSTGYLFFLLLVAVRHGLPSYGVEQRVADALVPPPDVAVHVPGGLRDLLAHVVQPLRDPLDPLP